MKYTARFLIFCFGFLALISAQARSAESAPKKNLCAITINSDDEFKLFKANLSEKDWNFIELIPQGQDGTPSKTWFQEACRKKVSCDVLVVSGHFGGTFFGSSRYALSMEELEKYSCDANCDGILNRPKEVFLMGCNTLASKEKDARTPEEYMRVLLADGFSPSQASQIVSFRYSGFGDSFKYSMSQVFASTPRIYGFSSIGPSGKTVSKYLQNYLKSNEDNYKNFDRYVQRSGTKLNESLAQELRKTSFTQAQGLIQNMKSSEEKPYCYIRSPRVPRVEKLKLVRQLFNTQRAIQILSHIREFIHEMKTDKVPLSDEEKRILAEFARDEKVKNELLVLLNLKEDMYLPLKVNVINTLKDLDLISERFVIDTFNTLVDMKKPFTEERKNFICSSKLNAQIDPHSIPTERWTEGSFIESMLCLQTTHLEVQKRMAQAILTGPTSTARSSALWYFYSTKSRYPGIHTNFVKMLQSDVDSNNRQGAAMILRLMPNADRMIHQAIIRAALQEADENVLNQIIGTLKQLPLKVEEKQMFNKSKASGRLFGVLSRTTLS